MKIKHKGKEFKIEFNLPPDIDPSISDWMKDWIRHIEDNKRIVRKKKLLRILKNGKR
jgi:hypothetical protein